MNSDFRKIPGLARYWIDKNGVVIREGFYSNGNYPNPKNNKRFFKEKVIKCSLNKYGYYYFNSSESGKMMLVHRCVAKAFPEICGEWFDECQVDHINTITTDNRAENLRVCTVKENMNNPLTLFHKRKGSPSTTKEYRRQYYIEHKEQLLAKSAKWRNQNKERLKELKHNYYMCHRTSTMDHNNLKTQDPDYHKKYYAANKDKIKKVTEQ